VDVRFEPIAGPEPIYLAHTKDHPPAASLPSLLKEEAAETAASSDPASHIEMLLKLGRNAGELAVERAADRIDCRNNHNGNAGGNKSVFDRGGTGFVFQKRENSRHVTNSLWLFYVRYVTPVSLRNRAAMPYKPRGFVSIFPTFKISRPRLLR
jgi:hypothetical protein